MSLSQQPAHSTTSLSCLSLLSRQPRWFQHFRRLQPHQKTTKNMSSIVKKATHFTPKVKKRVLRKHVLATPPATQTGAEETQNDTRDNTNDAVVGAVAQAESPPATQSNSAETGNLQGQKEPQNVHFSVSNDAESLNPLLSYSISAKPAESLLKEGQEDAVVDPIHKAPENGLRNSDIDSENDEDYGDNDIFKQPLVKEQLTRRRSSVVSQRRLSGIIPNRRNSSVSISATPTAAHTEGEVPLREAPVTIGVPLGKTTRKRRASSVSRPGKKPAKGQAIPIAPVSDILAEEKEAEPSSENEASNEKSKPVDVAAISKSPAKTKTKATGDYIVGLDPKTNKMRKFRTSKDVEDKQIPVAPEDLVTTLSSVSQLPRKVKPEDEQLFALVTLEAEQISMADLCKPMVQIGQTSETFVAAEKAKEKILLRKEERRKARKRARELRISYVKALREVQGDTFEEEAPKKQVDFELLAPQQPEASNLRLTVVEGQMQVDQESVVRDRGQGHNNVNRLVEEENPFENPVNANTYSNASYTDAWTTDEMVEFYRALSTWGTDFTFIAQLFPYRTRRQIKNKFNLEEKYNPELIELALRRKLPANFEEFQTKASSVQLVTSVEEFNKEMAEIQKEHEAHIREITAERERAIKEDLEANRKREIEIRTGSKPLTKAERSRITRANEVVVGEIEDVKRTRESIDGGNGGF